MSLRATLWALDDVRTGDPITKLVLIALADEADDNGGSCYPSLRRIAHRAECSVSTARRHVTKLEDAGLVVVHRPDRQGRGHHNRYELALPERVPVGNPLEHGNARKRFSQGGTNPSTRMATTSGCVECGKPVTTDPATGDPNLRCKPCHVAAKPGRAPAAQRPVGPAYQQWQPDEPVETVTADVARQTLSEARRRVQVES